MVRPVFVGSAVFVDVELGVTVRVLLGVTEFVEVGVAVRVLVKLAGSGVSVLEGVALRVGVPVNVGVMLRVEVLVGVNVAAAVFGAFSLSPQAVVEELLIRPQLGDI